MHKNSGNGVCFIFSQEADSYRIVHSGKTQQFMNSVFCERREKHPICKGDLFWDHSGERKKGLAWQEKAICYRCGYESDYYKLYTEIENKKKGPKTATCNVGALWTRHSYYFP